MTSPKKAELTDLQWDNVFTLRCRSKRGERLAPEELALCSRAHRSDSVRYAAMGGRVFAETAPFGARVSVPSPGGEER